LAGPAAGVCEPRSLAANRSRSTGSERTVWPRSQSRVVAFDPEDGKPATLAPEDGV